MSNKRIWKDVVLPTPEAVRKLEAEVADTDLARCYPNVRFIFDVDNRRMLTNCSMPLLVALFRENDLGASPRTHVLDDLELSVYAVDYPALQEFVVCCS